MSSPRMAGSSAGTARARAAAVVFVWAMAALAGGAFCAGAAGQVIPTPTTEAPATTEPVTGPPTTKAPATTRPTVARTVPRRASTTGPSTTPPTTTPTTVAGTLPPTTAGPTPATATIPLEETKPGEGKMPAWPMVLSGVGLAGAAGILGRQWLLTRSH